MTSMLFWLISSSFSFADVLGNIFRWHCPTGNRSKEIIFKHAREKEDDEAQGRFNLHEDSWEYGNASPSFHYVNSIDGENSVSEESMNMTWAWWKKGQREEKWPCRATRGFVFMLTSLINDTRFTAAILRILNTSLLIRPLGKICRRRDPIDSCFFFFLSFLDETNQ